MTQEKTKKWMKKAEKFRKKHAITLTSTSSSKSKKQDEEEILGNGKSDAQVCAKKCYAPYRTFKRALGKFPEKCSKVLGKVVENGGFKTPSPIQAQSWPILLKGKDLIGIAATGSGKTLAFLIPAISKLLETSSSNTRNPRVLVLAPTRELAMQSAKVAAEVSTVCKSLFKGQEALRSMVVYGGASKHDQRRTMRSQGGVDVLMATPGRLLDFCNEGTIDLSNVDYLVLDEADRMLDMGFERDVRSIVSMTSPKRQTLMFSATWPEEIRSIAHEMFTDPLRIIVGSGSLQASDTVTQHVEVLDPREKDRRLRALLQKHHNGKNRVLVFALYKKEAARLEGTLSRFGYRGGVASIHGDKAQAAREEAVASFKDGSTPILVATDVAARGLDIKGVEFVINYTFPLTIEDYVHRIGRTGRAGATGTAFTFFTQHDKARAGELQNVLRKAGVAIPEDLAKFGNTVKKKEHKLYGAHFRKYDDDKPMPKAKRIRFD